MDTTQIRHSILAALGDGGTMDMADGVLAYLTPLLEDDAKRLEPDPFAEDSALELAGLAEVAELTGRPKQLIGHWVAGRRKPENPFPKPRWQLSSGPVWERSIVLDWCRAEGRIGIDD